MGCASEKLEFKVGGTNSASPDHSISSYIQYIYNYALLGNAKQVHKDIQRVSFLALCRLIVANLTVIAADF